MKFDDASIDRYGHYQRTWQFVGNSLVANIKGINNRNQSTEIIGFTQFHGGLYYPDHDKKGVKKMSLKESEIIES